MTSPKVRKKTIVNESAVVSACMKWLYAYGCIAMRNNTGGLPSTYIRKNGTIGRYLVRFGRTGWGDIIFCTPKGRFGEIECKAGYNKQQPPQRLHQEEVEGRHGIYIVAYSVDDLEARRAEIFA